MTGASPSVSNVKPVLFVCVENSNRSQMAEAFARIHGHGRFEAYSAGSQPSGRINPAAIQSMAELGYDLSTHRSQSLDAIPRFEFAAVVTMGCGDSCPAVTAGRREDWEIPDPKSMPPEQFREIRDHIETRVRDLLTRL